MTTKSPQDEAAAHMVLTKEQLLGALQNRLGLDIGSIGDETPLFSSGLIDSFSLVELITFIETQAGFRMDPMDVSLENLDSVERILRFANQPR
jgi:acyl carrier protein